MKTFKILLSLALATVFTFSLVACSGTNSGKDEWDSDKEYTIQYADDDGSHTISVKNGELYSLTGIPTKTGYEFLGLFDAEVGGTQYVSASGTSLAAFTDGKNIVLFPQFKAKEYTLVLDYQGAAVTGVRSMQVSYNSLINNLPSNLTLENKNFVGWFTAPEKQGNQVADQYGSIPAKNIVNENIFDFSDPNGYIYLYAGFKGEEFNVTFYYDGISTPEEIKVEYGTYIADVQTETRVDGKAVIVWSKTKNDTNKENVFSGKVTSEMVLYSTEFAPVIDFDTNGGNKINSIVKRAGEAITLPTPVKENYKFAGWKTGNGTAYNATTMPSTSVKLFADWQAMIIFEENGGTLVNYISQAQGTSVTLPETEKSGYMFAGWYEANGNKYTSTSMPAASIKLYAKYYKVLTEKKVIVADSTTVTINGYSSVAGKPYLDSSDRYREIDVSDLYNIEVRKVKITINYRCKHNLATASKNCTTYLNFYYSKTASDAYLIMQFSEKHNDANYRSYSYTTTAELKSSQMYCTWFTDLYGYYDRENPFWTDIWLEIEYPDMSTLY